MTVILALSLSVIFQFIAACIAISLIRQTRYNISWVLISAAFVLMAVRRILELSEVLHSVDRIAESPYGSWTAVAISVFMLAGLIYIQRIFKQQKRIDDLKRENESRILSAIIHTEEKERLTFAKELHDGLGPLLASIKMAVSALVSNKTEKSRKEILDNTNKLIDESVSAIKEISNKLSPHVLNHFGLLKAVRAFVDRMEWPDGFLIKVNSNLEEIRFDRDVEVVMYRVVCELITNTITHAEASEVNIDLFYDHGSLTLDYYDNGKGFETGEIPKIPPGMGLSNIQSRVRSIGGSFKVISGTDEGVCINVIINTRKHG
jgi:signal transduction histidine kinase